MLDVRHAPRLGRRPVGRVPDSRAVRRRLEDDEASLDALALRAALPGGIISKGSMRDVVVIISELALWRVRVRLREQDELVRGLVAQPVPSVLRGVSKVR